MEGCGTLVHGYNGCGTLVQLVQWLWLWYTGTWAHLIFVASISSGASVIFFD